MRRYIVLVLSMLTLTLALGMTVLAQSQPVTHVVQWGETLYRISLRYNRSISAIAQANNISNINLIYAGQRLTIPDTTGPSPTTPAPTTPAPGGTTYRVVYGDTLGNIARRFGTTITAIAQANGITNPNLIFAGQTLTIPGGTGPTATPPPGPTTPPPPGGFEIGGHVFSFSYPEQMRGAGMTWAKVQVRYNQGDAPSTAQDEINAVRNRNFKVLLSVVGDPAQLAANPTQYYQDFANFLGGVAALNPDAIEVWNEQNIDREWPRGLISGQNYTQMLSAAYQAIKARNSNVLVISGAPAPTGFFGGCGPNGCDDNFFIRQMRDAGAANFLDCVGVHYNEGIIPPNQRSGDPRGNSSHYTRYFFGMHDLYSSTFPGKPLCFTEIGYLSSEGFSQGLPAGFEWASTTSAQEQAEWIGQAVSLARGTNRVRLFIVWNIDATTYNADPQAGFAIVRPNNTCLACITIGAAMGQ